MRRPVLSARRSVLGLVAGASIVLGVYFVSTFAFDSHAQDAVQTEERNGPSGRTVAPKRDAPKTAPKTAAPAPTPKAATPSSARAASPAAGSQITAKLRESGAGACAGQIDGLAAGVMGGVAQFNTVSSWANTGSDKRAVSVAIGQSYGPDKAVPYAATSIFAAPNSQGGCDGMSVQVVPSPLSCDKLRESLSAKGRQLGDLAGVLLMQDGGGQTLLVPTAVGACVLIGLKTAYAQ